jgi:hypothetical protein
MLFQNFINKPASFRLQKLNLKVYLILTFVLLMISVNLEAQFSVKTQLVYLKQINHQGRKDLIKDNLQNADKCAEDIISGNDTTQEAGLFFAELSYSYFLIKQPEKSIYNLLCQRILTPDSILSSQSKPFFFEVCYQNGLSTNSATSLWKNTLPANIPESYNSRLELLLLKSIGLFKKELVNSIQIAGNTLMHNNYLVPAWYSDWEFLTMTGMKEKYKEHILDFNKSGHLPIYQSCTNTKLTAKIYRKAICYYRKQKSCTRARELKDEFKKLKQKQKI